MRRLSLFAFRFARMIAAVDDFARPEGFGAELDHLRHLIEHAAHVLPSQGPIEVFVHHNTLHAFEDQPFHAAVKQGLRTYGGNPYFPEPRYRELLEAGRIRLEDLRAVLHEDLGTGASASIAGLGTRISLRLAMLMHPLRTGPDAELRWVIAETDALRRFHPEVSSLIREHLLDVVEQFVLKSKPRIATDDVQQPTIIESLKQEFGGNPERWSERRWEEFVLRSLWFICRQGVEHVETPATLPPRGVRVRDALFAATGVDTDLLVHDLLIRFCAAFLDQDSADWELPARDQGLFRSFLTVFGEKSSLTDAWMSELSDEVFRLNYGQVTPLESIDDSLDLLGVPHSDQEAFIVS